MGAGEKPCTGQASAVFVIGLVAGTGCVIFSKTLFELKSEGLNGELLPFKPQAAMDAEPPVTVKTLLMLGLPAVFDLLSVRVLLMVAGLMHISASIWMLLRGGGIVFVALMKQFALGDRLTCTFCQSLQYVYEEKVMAGDAPPWLLIGMEGFFGARLLHERHHGVVESLPNTLLQIEHSQAIQRMALGFCVLALGFCVLVFILNSFSVTFMLSSVWHAILDNFRPITIWMLRLPPFGATQSRSSNKKGNTGAAAYNKNENENGNEMPPSGTAVYNGSVKLPWSPDGENLLGSGLFGGASPGRDFP
ncbi:hypothetical protein EMIHUDRAFT_221947 [Emiliania huxleyi CCMP1516]|uniref:Fatty acid desaturase domain-containing protein n=2 Tax=Emiliania huxleyi TaxID=2903 RepID=A0A0D3HXP1_EMIH1|nr:hypothetical protein EMIHUDRAFT_221947 [Emiliania huxleyi CCMP1516]EOD03776.1 hypothetical protein EMIHUDRAFT_221947 [Emiliania huxleyi CCMP1516]|eukprot:XP_005756205.1 hypothetical protein EMIHUDRAFT_221947 [Emiliania huxleyi CCMP1516]